MKCPGLHCHGCRPATGAWLVGLLVALGAVLVLTVAYRAAESALVGLAASTAEANRVGAWTMAALAMVAALAGAGWLLVSRRRAVRDAPIEAAFTARVDAALAARATTPAIPATPMSGPTVPVRARAVRLDRLDRLDGREGLGGPGAVS